MDVFLIAYVIVWLGVVWYVVRLGAEQRRLSRMVEDLHLRVEESRSMLQSTINAA